MKAMNENTTSSETPPSLPALQPELAKPARNERNWAVCAHLASVAGWVGIPMGHLLAPLIVLLIKKDESEFVRNQSVESLNFQLSMTIYALAAGFLAATIIGLIVAIPVFIAIVIGDIFYTIVGAIKASEGYPYRYPCTIRLVS